MEETTPVGHVFDPVTPPQRGREAVIEGRDVGIVQASRVGVQLHACEHGTGQVWVELIFDWGNGDLNGASLSLQQATQMRDLLTKHLDEVRSAR